MDTTNLSYIATNLDELMMRARPEIQEIVAGKDIDEAVAILGKLHKIPIGSYLALDNIILFILLGALKPEDAVRGIQDILKLPEEDSYKLAQDLEKTILEKARMKIFNRGSEDTVTLTFQEGRTPHELRKEILDTTKREPTVAIQPGKQVQSPALPAKNMAPTGTRSQLMEQLQILGSIPDDEEIANRLKKIQEQVADMQAKKEESTRRAEKEKEESQNSSIQIASPQVQSATYSRAPTQYNVDPYREVSELS